MIGFGADIIIGVICSNLITKGVNWYGNGEALFFLFYLMIGLVLCLFEVVYATYSSNRMLNTFHYLNSNPCLAFALDRATKAITNYDEV